MGSAFARLSQRPALAGGLAGVAAFALGQSLLTLLLSAPPSDEPLAADKIFATGNIWLISLMAVGWAPLFETAVGQWLPIELLRRLGAPPWARLLASAGIFSAGHVLNGGGALQGVLAFLFGALLAALYLRFRDKGQGSAFAAAWACHCANNSLAAAGIALGFS